ncbi:MAG: M20/M25/M40 family metallo-hydrolase [Anaerolineae bacterium]|nr:M20/M25/M40 family metallo-hydrolase [Anaerolineae bacterium]
MTSKHPFSQSAPRRHLALGLAALLLIMSTLACNLSSTPPPTVPPRLPTSTPQATIGISTQVPIALPGGIEAEAPIDPGLDALLRQVDTDRLMQHVRALYELETRYVNSTQTSPTRGIGAARQYIHDTMVSYSGLAEGRLTVWDHPFTVNWEGQQTLQHNVIATLQGVGSGSGVIVVGAHYDSTANDTDPALSAPGADDNGSGIAALLEMARILAQAPQKATVMFVAFSAEEIGRIGSLRFIDEYLKPFNIDVRAVITLDTIGSVNGPNNEVNDYQIRVFSDDQYNSSSRQLSRVMNLIATTYVPELQVMVEAAGDREGRWGDHMSFTARGYPAIRIIEAIQDPARQNNSRDTIEYVNPAYLTRSTRVALATALVMANGLQPPENVSLRTNPNDPANNTLVWSPVEGAVGYVLALRQPGALNYNQVLNINATNSLTWSGFTPDRFETVAIAAIDSSGRWGPFSPEYVLGQ